MCLAIPGKIRKLKSKEIAEVDFDGLFKDVNISLVEAKVGDFVIVHSGFAIEKMEKDVAENIQGYLGILKHCEGFKIEQILKES